MRRSDLGAILLFSMTFAVGIAIGAVLYSVVGPHAAVIPGEVQTAALSFAGVLVAATAGLTGGLVVAVLGARATRDAQTNAERLRLFTDVLRTADRYVTAFGHQFNERRRAAGDGAGKVTTTLPAVDRLRRAIDALYAFAQQDTADAAADLNSLVMSLAHFHYDAAKHLVGTTVVGPEPEEEAAVRDLLAAYVPLKTVYLQRVRKELGLGALEPRAV